MATLLPQTNCCNSCGKNKVTYVCDGCSARFCLVDLVKHRENLREEFDRVGIERDQLREMINDSRDNPVKYPLMKEIDQWEDVSIERIRQMANECRENFFEYTKTFSSISLGKLDQWTKEMIEIRREENFNDLILHQMKQKLNQLQMEFIQPTDLILARQPTSFLTFISLRVKSNSRYKPLGITVAGGKGYGNRLGQLSCPCGIHIDFDQTIYIADCYNGRIMEKTLNAIDGRIVAGGRELGDPINQLDNPTDVVIDYEDDSFIIADQGNRRVLRQSRQSNTQIKIIISDIDCSRLAMHKDGTLYVSDCVKNEVRRWKRGDIHGTLVAGGNGEGDQLNQLYHPTYLFVDDDHTLFVSDTNNHRVVKWIVGAKEGIVVAGGNGRGDRRTQLNVPQGVIVDFFGRIYIADLNNSRLMRWCEGDKEGTMILDGKDKNRPADESFSPVGLAFDTHGNLYLADADNQQVLKFEFEQGIKE